MKVHVVLDLGRYDIRTVMRLFKEGILSEDETVGELMSRGVKDWKALVAVRAVG